MQWVYLDNNATTQPADEVVAAMDEVNRTLWANPSSVHRFGQMVRQRVELARASVANLLHTRDRNIIFTSGGTESNNLALRGLLGDTRASHRALITTKVEHSAIRSPADALAELGVALHHLPVDRDRWHRRRMIRVRCAQGAGGRSRQNAGDHPCGRCETGGHGIGASGVRTVCSPVLRFVKDTEPPSTCNS